MQINNIEYGENLLKLNNMKTALKLLFEKVITVEDREKQCEHMQGLLNILIKRETNSLFLLGDFS